MMKPFPLESNVTAGSALELLYEFHALQYPDLHQQPAYLAYIQEATHPGAKPPEEPLCNPAMPIKAKAEHLQATFRRVATPLFEGSRKYRHEALVEFCDLQRTALDAEILTDSAGNELPTGLILPPADIAQTLYDYRLHRSANRGSTYPFSEYITQVLSSQSSLR